MTERSLSQITLPKEPASSLFFSYTYPQSKEFYLKELLQRTWGVKQNPVWQINHLVGDIFIKNNEDRARIINESLKSLKSKIGKRSFDRSSRAFRFRCGEFVDTPITDLSSTYLWLELHHSLKNKFQNLHFFNQTKNEQISESTNRINNIYLLLANDGQAILIVQIEHNTTNLAQLIEDIHPLQTDLNRTVISLKNYVDPKYYKEKPVENWGYLKDFVGQTQVPIAEGTMCSLLDFFGWLIFEQWNVPSDKENYDAQQYSLFDRLSKTSLSYRMHHVEISSEDWASEPRRDALAFYLGRGTKLEKDTFKQYDHEYQFTKSYFRNWDHLWIISRDSIVSLTEYNNSNTYNFTTERFWKGYQILTLQVLIEYLGCMRFTYQIAKIAYKKKDKDKLTHLIKNMHQFRLGINLVDFSQRASEAEYYSILRKVFNVDRLVDELNNEVKDVLEIISMIKLEEDEARREQEQIAREEQREQERKQREEQKKLDDQRYRDREEQREQERKRREEQKQLDDQRYRVEEKERNQTRDLVATQNHLAQQQREQERKRREKQHEKEEQRRQKQDTLLSILGATTIPFALVSGLMGMNTDLEDCPKDRGILDILQHPKGMVPCLTFNEVIGVCILLGAAIFFTYRYILKRNAEK